MSRKLDDGARKPASDLPREYRRCPAPFFSSQKFSLTLDSSRSKLSPRKAVPGHRDPSYYVFTLYKPVYQVHVHINNNTACARTNSVVCAHRDYRNRIHRCIGHGWRYRGCANTRTRVYK
ncbi:hypothetical protein PUN28_007901 [Cardiocondyla obscurior]|uniref:Uncharacterized protein n=1 Tax=Cardiocondyla obscurior TaxID=286306 RepID=A0AAW2FWX6_9HYME